MLRTACKISNLLLIWDDILCVHDIRDQGYAEIREGARCCRGAQVAVGSCSPLDLASEAHHSYRAVTVQISSLAQLQQKVCADQVREFCRQQPATLPLLLLVLTASILQRFRWGRSSIPYRDVTGPEACC